MPYITIVMNKYGDILGKEYPSVFYLSNPHRTKKEAEKTIQPLVEGFGTHGNIYQLYMPVNEYIKKHKIDGYISEEKFKEFLIENESYNHSISKNPTISTLFDSAPYVRKFWGKNNDKALLAAQIAREDEYPMEFIQKRIKEILKESTNALVEIMEIAQENNITLDELIFREYRRKIGILDIPFMSMVALYGDARLLDEFIKLNFDLNVRDNRGFTVLHYAALGKQLEIINYLYNLDFDMNATSNSGQNAAHIAAIYGDIRTMEVLADCGVTPTVIDKENENKTDEKKQISSNSYNTKNDDVLKSAEYVRLESKNFISFSIEDSPQTAHPVSREDISLATSRNSVFSTPSDEKKPALPDANQSVNNQSSRTKRKK